MESYEQGGILVRPHPLPSLKRIIVVKWVVQYLPLQKEKPHLKLGANSVLFGGYDMETAFKHIAMAGYDGIELSAIDGMSQHLVLANWQELAADIKRFAKEYELDLLAMGTTLA